MDKRARANKQARKAKVAAERAQWAAVPVRALNVPAHSNSAVTLPGQGGNAGDAECIAYLLTSMRAEYHPMNTNANRKNGGNGTTYNIGPANGYGNPASFIRRPVMQVSKQA